MSFLDFLSANGAAGSGAAPATPPVQKDAGGAKDFASFLASKPAGGTPAAPADTKTAPPSFSGSLPQSPAMTPTSQKYFSTTTPQGTSIGFSSENDSSGIPYLAYRNPGDTATSTDLTRVATGFDPRVPQPLTPGSFTTPRAVANRAALKSALGGSYSDELDHTISLELAGSNNKANLRVEPNVPGTTNTATDPLENSLAKQVVAGKISLWDAQEQLAKAKGVALPYIGDTVKAYENTAATPANPTYPDTPLGKVEQAASGVWDFAKHMASTVISHVAATISSPSGALASGQGFVQSAIIKPASFMQGIANGILSLENKGIESITGKPAPYAPENIFASLSNMNTSLTRGPEEQQAYETGNFFGWLVPYGKVARGTEAVLDAAKLTEKITPKLAPLLPYISDAAGFLGTGQILHSPDEGSRVDQLRNDAIALALFDVGGVALRMAGIGVAKGLSKILPDSVKEAATNAMQPVYDLLHKGQKVPVDLLDNSVSDARSVVQDATGKTPQELVQAHLGLGDEPAAEVSAPTRSDTAQEAHDMIAHDMPGLVEQYLKENGNVINTDQARELFPGYVADRSRSADVHEPASEVAKAAYEKLLGERQGEGNNTVLFSAGGTGAGKSVAVADKEATKEFPIIYDTNMAGTESAAGKIEQALAKGYDVALTYVHNDISTSLDNALGRASRMEKEKGSGRTVPLDEHIKTHMNAPDAFAQLYDHYKDNPHVFFGAFNNEGNIHQAVTGHPVDFVKQKAYTGSNEELRAKLEAQIAGAHAEGKISDRTKNGFLGKESGGENSGPNGRGNAQEIRAGQSITLPEFPSTGRPLLGVAFPGANYVARFIEKDILDRFSSVKEAVQGVYKASKDMFAPDVVTKKTEAIVGSSLMKLERFKSAAWAVAEKRRDWWAKMSEEDQNDFLNKMESKTTMPGLFTKQYGEGVSKTMADLANEYRTRLDQAYKLEQKAGVKTNYIKDYFPHYWDDPEAAATAFQKYIDTFGKGAFTNKRTIDLIAIGRSLGLSLRTTNPEELVIMREIDGIRVTSQIEMIRELQSEGLAIPVEKSNADRYRTWPLYNGPDGKRYAVPPDAAKILKNAFFEKSLWSTPGFFAGVFRTLMTIKGTIVPIQLSLSAFHPIHIMFIHTSSERARAWEGIIKGNLSPVDAMKALARPTSLVSQVADVGEFHNIVTAWDKPDTVLNERQKQILQYIIDGGGTPKMSEEFAIRAKDSFKGALRDDNLIGAGIRYLPKIIEGYQKPVFESYIPALKIASYTRGVEALLRATPELATNDVARKAAFRNLWQSIDNRYGQMVYKTLFWKPVMKQVMQASFLSLGWNLGFVREFGGGAFDLGKLLAKGTLGKATKDDITQRMLFSIDYTAQAALVGGLMTYAMTGKMPQGTQDLFFPRTGSENPDGSVARLNTSFYTREYFSALNHWQKQGFVQGSVSLVENKMNPLLRNLSELYGNRDFYGYEIHNPNSTIAQQAAQTLQYFIKSGVTPISLAGAEQAYSVTGVKGVTASFAGFNPAPKYIADTPMQTEIQAALDRRTGGLKPLAGKDAQSAKNNIRTLYEQGNIDAANEALDAAVKAGYIKPTAKSTFIRTLDLPADVRQFKTLAQYSGDQEALLSSMSEEDLARYANYASNDLKSRLSTLSPTAKKFVEDLHAGKIQLTEFKAGKPTTEQPQ